MTEELVHPLAAVRGKSNRARTSSFSSDQASISSSSSRRTPAIFTLLSMLALSSLAVRRFVVAAHPTPGKLPREKGRLVSAARGRKVAARVARRGGRRGERKEERTPP